MPAALMGAAMPLLKRPFFLVDRVGIPASVAMILAVMNAILAIA